MNGQGEGLALVGPHGPVRLKWHKLRRRPDDYPFDLANLAAAGRLGASCEVDLRLLADGIFACLHDSDLDLETTGSGPVAHTNSQQLRDLRLRHPETGAPDGQAPPLLEDLVTVLVRGGAHADAVVQLDIKDDDPPPQNALDRFASVLGGHADCFLASGTSWQSVAALGAAVPSLRLGFDPTELAQTTPPGDAAAFARFAEATLEAAPTAQVIYLPYQLLMKAAAAKAPVVRMFRDRGCTVDCWTLDPDRENIRDCLPIIVGLGVDQITTNAPLALERIWREMTGDVGA